MAVDASDRIWIASTQGYLFTGGRNCCFFFFFFFFFIFFLKKKKKTVARFTPEGVVDTSLNGNGAISFAAADTRATSSKSYLKAVIVDQNQKIILSGHSWWDKCCFVTARGYDFSVARLTTAGELDSSFASGKGFRNYRLDGYELKGGLVRELSNNQYLVAGMGRHVNSNSRGHLVLLRLNSDGGADPSFGSDGFVTIHLNNQELTLSSFIVTKSNHLVVSGDLRDGNPISNVFFIFFFLPFFFV
jgi:uncharacterized delta-60 repeat protein